MFVRFTRWAQLRIALVFFFALIGTQLQAQEYRGSLSGNVTDQTGALIPNATLTIKNTATNAERSVGTSDRGAYTALNLDAGFYTVTVTAAGFKTLVRNNIEVRSGEKYGLDLSLQIGAQSQEVVVTTAISGVITDTGSGGTVLNQNLASTLPLSGGNIFTLTQTTAGANHGGGSLSHLSERPFDNGGQESYSINGGASGGNNNAFLIDGAPNNNNEGLAFVPPQDAVSQVNVLTNAYDAEFGKTGGGTVSVSLKSGSNAYHGSGSWDFRNNHTDAQLYQNFGQKPQVTQWSVGTFTANGPVMIPHVYNGRNRTFLSGSYQHFFDKIANQANRTIPSVSQAMGNFCSSAPGNQGIGTVIYDPLSPNASARTAFGGCPTGDTGSNLQVAAPSRIDPVAAKLLTNFPAANVTNTATGVLCTNSRVSGCATNYTVPAGRGDHYYAFTIRADHNISEKEKFFGSYEVGNRTEFIFNPGTVSAVTSPFYPQQTTFRKNHAATLNLTSILSPTLTATSKFNWLRHNGLGRTSDPGATPESFGISSAFAGLFGADNFPGFNFTNSGATSYTGFVQGGQNLTTYSDTFTASESLNKVVSSQSLKAGGGITTLLQNNRTAAQIPAISYTSGFTQSNYLKPDGNSGDAIASALLGYSAGTSATNNLSGIGFTNPLSLSYKDTYVFVFAQDDWRVNKKLTLNLGLRWDNQTAPHERYNRSIINFNPGAPSITGASNVIASSSLTPAQNAALSAQITNGVGGSYIGGLTYANPDNRTAYKSSYKNFQPRFGFAYAVNEKFVIRGGWGRSYDFQGAYTFAPTTGFQQTSTAASSSDGVGQFPVLCSQTPGCAVPAANPLAGLSANGFASAFPSGILSPTGASLGSKTGAGTSISFIDPDFRPSHVNQFNFGFEYQLPFRMVAHLEYNGSRAYGLPVTKSINQLTAAQFLSLKGQANAVVANPFPGLAGTSLSTANTTAGQLLRPFPQYTDVQETNMPIGRLWYNSMQAKLDKRLSYGLDAYANFTWGKNLGATTYLNPSYDSLTNLTRQLVTMDVPFSTNIGMTWALPIFTSPDRKFLHAALGGWSVSGNAAFHSGTLIASPTGTSGVTYTGVNPGKVIPGTFNGRTFANGYNACVINSAGTALLANSACPGTATIANASWRQTTDSFYLSNIPPVFGSNRYAAPPYASAVIFKSFPITERVKAEVRLLGENITNTPYFTSLASASPTANTFTQINKTQSNDPRSLQLTGRISF